PCIEQRSQPVYTPHRDQEAEQPAAARERKTLDDELSYDPAAARPERGANRKLTLAHGRSCEQEIGDVGACDEQEQRDGPEEQLQRRLRFPAHAIAEWHERQRHTLVGRGELAG